MTKNNQKGNQFIYSINIPLIINHFKIKDLRKSLTE